MAFEAAAALETIGAEAVPGVKTLLDNGSWSARHRALELLARMKATGVRGDIQRLAIEDPNPAVRLAAEHALGVLE